jgi:TnpA family transposase
MGPLLSSPFFHVVLVFSLFLVTTNALIREQWDQLVRLAASLRNRTAPAHVVLRRLASSAPSDRLAKALTALGWALRSLYL